MPALGTDERKDISLVCFFSGNDGDPDPDPDIRFPLMKQNSSILSVIQLLFVSVIFISSYSHGMTNSAATKRNNVQKLQSIGMEKRDLPVHKDLPRASVLVPLFMQNEKLHVLLTQRPMKLKSHPGEVCFPGGRQDVEDGGDDIVTAFRETYEEVGLAKSSFQPLCRLSTVESRNGLCVTPIVALWRPLTENNENSIWSCMKISEDEVESAFAVPLDFFLEENGNLAEKTEIPWSGGRFTMRKYYYQEESESSKRTFKVWGLTAHIVHEVAMIAMNKNLDDDDS